MQVGRSHEQHRPRDVTPTASQTEHCPSAHADCSGTESALPAYDCWAGPATRLCVCYERMHDPICSAGSFTPRMSMSVKDRPLAEHCQLALRFGHRKRMRSGPRHEPVFNTEWVLEKPRREQDGPGDSQTGESRGRPNAPKSHKRDLDRHEHPTLRLKCKHRLIFRRCTGERLLIALFEIERGPRSS